MIRETIATKVNINNCVSRQQCICDRIHLNFIPYAERRDCQDSDGAIPKEQLSEEQVYIAVAFMEEMGQHQMMNV